MEQSNLKGFLLLLLFQNIGAMERELFKKEVSLKIVEITPEKDAMDDDTLDAIAKSQNTLEKQLAQSQIIAEQLPQNKEPKPNNLNFEQIENDTILNEAFYIDSPLPPSHMPSSTNVGQILAHNFSQSYGKTERIYSIDILLHWFNLTNNKPDDLVGSLLHKILEKMPIESYNDMLLNLQLIKSDDFAIDEEKRTKLVQKIIEFFDIQQEYSEKNSQKQSQEIQNIRNQINTMIKQARWRLTALKATGTCAALCALWAAVTTYFVANN